MTLMNCLILAFLLFGIGVWGLMRRRHLIGMLISIELMLNAANINFITFASFKTDATGQVFVIMSIAVAAAEVAVGIALMLNAYKMKKTTEVDKLSSMRW